MKAKERRIVRSPALPRFNTSISMRDCAQVQRWLLTISLFALSQNEGGKGFVFVPMIPRVLGYLCPGDMGLSPPAVEQNTLLEGLTSGRNYDGVILAPSIRLRFRPMELERLQLKRIQSNEKLR